MMYQAFSPIRFFNLDLRTLSGYTQNLVVILRFAPLQRRLCLFQFRLQGTDVGVRCTALRLGLLNRGFEIGDGGIVFLEVEVDPSAGAEGFEGVGGEQEGGVGIG
jgi:hypothetical protein